MKIEDACIHWLFNEYREIAISRQHLLSKFLRIWLDQKYKDKEITKLPDGKRASRIFKRFCKRLLKEGEVRADKWGAKGFRYLVVKNESKESIEKVLSAIYPIGYIGYMSAIKHYNLTSSKTNSIYFVTVNRADWKRLCLKDIYGVFPELKTNESFFDDFFESIRVEDLIPTYPVEETTYNAQIAIVNQKRLALTEVWNDVRVESLPYLYIDILRNPKYCGGLGQVLQLYSTMSESIFKEVIEILENESQITNMDRARFGFIFEKVLQKHNIIFSKWKDEQMLKRGGTRKLVSYLPFDSTFDEDWNISVNYDLAKPYASSNSS